MMESVCTGFVFGKRPDGTRTVSGVDCRHAPLGHEKGRCSMSSGLPGSKFIGNLKRCSAPVSHRLFRVPDCCGVFYAVPCKEQNSCCASDTEALETVSGYIVYWIRQSSNEVPAASNSLTQRGCLPRPDHVSDGNSGFRNFGRTFGYGRGWGISFGEPPNLTPSSSNRLSNFCF